MASRLESKARLERRGRKRERDSLCVRASACDLTVPTPALPSRQLSSSLPRCRSYAMHALPLHFHMAFCSISCFSAPPPISCFCFSPSSMGSLLPCFLLLAMAALIPIFSFAFPVCLNKDAPGPLKTSLAFCSSYRQNDSSCCDASMDHELSNTFQAFNVSDSQCAIHLKEVLCAQCDPYSGDLFQTQLGVERSAPLLCNSTSGSNSTSKSYCDNVWDACKSAPIKNSPFATTGASQSAQNASVLTNFWQSQADFCTALGGTHNSGDFCFNGGKFTDFNTTTPLAKLEGICFEKVGDGMYLNMIPHPDGSNRVFVASQSGKIWIATVPTAGSQDNLTVDETTPFLDISDRVISSGEYGLLGVAFHPDFEHNGRFFVSYSCDKAVWPDCAGRCACNADAGCIVANLGPDAGSTPCQVSTVVAEYSVNTSSSSSFLKAAVANPDEVRRIFTMSLPFSNHHGGQILFGPIDSYLYLMIGDGGSHGDPFNFAQNKMSLLGKILRFNVNSLPSANEVASLQLWGNYSVPADNPFGQDNTSLPEIWAYGLRNPWRCAFDKIKPEYFYCGDVGQEKFEEVDLITRGGNYGWRVYEGTTLYTPTSSPGGNTSAASIQPISPILEYSHASVNPTQNSASITGGYVSRSTQDACLYGRYVYADLYGHAMWAAAEMPAGSGNYTTSRLNFTCSDDSPMECKQANSSVPNFLYLLSFGEDNYNNLYALSATGVYRVVDPKGCGYTCNATLPPDAFVNSPPVSNSSESPAPSPNVSVEDTSIGHVNLPTWTFLSATLALLALQLFGF